MKNGDFTQPLHDRGGSIVYLDEKFLCKNALKVKFTCTFLTLWEPLETLEINFSGKRSKMRFFEKGPSPIHSNPSWGVLPCPSMYLLPASHSFLATPSAYTFLISLDDDIAKRSLKVHMLVRWREYHYDPFWTTFFLPFSRLSISFPGHILGLSNRLNNLFFWVYFSRFFQSSA